MFCPNCGNEFTPAPSCCSSCGAGVATPTTRDRVVRPRAPRMIAGVCSGIALHYGWDIYIVRLVLAVTACLTTGAVILFYIAAWVMIPEGHYALPASAHDTGPYAAY